MEESPNVQELTDRIFIQQQYNSFKDADQGNHPPGEINKNKCHLHIRVEALGPISLRT